MSHHVSIAIGGGVSRESLERMLVLAADRELVFWQTDEHVSEVIRDGVESVVADIDAFLDARSLLSLHGRRRILDHLPEMERACRREGLPYVVHTEDEEGEAEPRATWHGETQGSCVVNADGEAVVTVQAVCAAMAEGTLDTLIAKHTIARIPPLQLED